MVYNNRITTIAFTNALMCANCCRCDFTQRLFVDVEYTTDGFDFDKRDKAIKHGLKTQGSDDFNIGVIEGGKLVSFDWMNEPVGESAETLAEIAEAIGYEGTAQ